MASLYNKKIKKSIGFYFFSELSFLLNAPGLVFTPPKRPPCPRLIELEGNGAKERFPLFASF